MAIGGEARDEGVQDRGLEALPRGMAEDDEDLNGAPLPLRSPGLQPA
jgi:hypothetical protein